MAVSPEEFFMYLTVALIVLIPLAARVYRSVTARQVKRMLRVQLGQQEEGKTTGAHGKK